MVGGEAGGGEAEASVSASAAAAAGGGGFSGGVGGVLPGRVHAGGLSVRSGVGGAEALEDAFECVKCPTLAYHLAGTKKVQQQLAQPGEVERFLGGGGEGAEDGGAAAAAVRACFAELHAVSGEGRGEAAEAAIADALDEGKEPCGWVLKPQREGGGNNFYSEELRAKLREGSDEDLADLILMERILPPLQPALLVTRGQVRSGVTISELGVFGTFLAVDEDDDEEGGEGGGRVGK